MKKNKKHFLVAFLLSFLLVSLLSGSAFAATSGQKAADPVLPPVSAEETAKTYTILMYHHLVPDSEIYPGSPNYQNGAVLSVENFDAQMKTLADAGANVIFVSELYHYLGQGLLPPKGTVVIVFDDGYLSNYIYAFPILQRYNIKANISVVVHSSECSAGDGVDLKKIPHFSLDQMKEMSSSGLVEFGSHTYDGHGTGRTDIYGTESSLMVNPIYNNETGLMETDLEYRARISNELSLSKYIIEKVTGQKVIYYAYTNGKYNQALKETLASNGYQLAFTVANRRARASDSLLLLPRVNVPNEMDLTAFRQVIQGE